VKRRRQPALWSPAYWWPMWFRPTEPRHPGKNANWIMRYWFKFRMHTYPKRHRRWYYEVYLKSYHWRCEVRPAALRRDNYHCQHKGCTECGEHLDVHHKVYWYLGKETDRPEWFSRSVVTLCRFHHDRAHFKVS
jgi:hypothetical protein